MSKNKAILDLSGLRDIHQVAEPSFFPPAIGWWIAFGAFIFFVGCVAFIWYRYYYMSSKNYALRVLKEIKKAPLTSLAVGVKTGQLLKRVALVCFPRTDVANLYGTAWADFLYKTGEGILSRSEAEFIAQSTYMPVQKKIAFDEKKFYTHVRRWIKFVFKRGSYGNKRTRYSSSNSRRK